jgi:outer membrane protein OmpA-like peptidoglycan-associated protein
LRWLGLAILLSLLFHGMLFFWFRDVLLNWGPPAVDPVEPPRFNLEQAKIDPKFFESQLRNTPPTQEHLPELDPEKIAAFEGPLDAPRLPVPSIPMEEPSALSGGPSNVPVEAFSALEPSLEGNTPQITQSLLGEASASALKEAQNTLGQSLLGGGPTQEGTAGSIPSSQDISNLVELRKPDALVRPGFQPILLRLSSDLLFEFDSATLLPNAEQKLQLVADYLKDAVKAQVTVEGHTDTIGAEDYNQKLSERRAEAVATWLEKRAQLGKNAITTKGYGETRPIVNPNGDIKEQEPNRRVEIRIEGER